MQPKDYCKKESFVYRITIGILFPAVLGLGILYLYYWGNPFRCWFYQLTGLYCTGCGSGRAAYNLIHGHFIKAADYNLFFVLFLPLLALYSLKYYIEAVFNKRILRRFKITAKFVLPILIFIFLFTVLRNIQLFPFTYLAP